MDEHFQHFPSNSLVANQETALAWFIFMSACAVSLYFALEKWSSPSVRDDFGEVGCYLIFSLMWIALTQGAFAFLGISIRDEVAERRNRSAGFAVAGNYDQTAFALPGAVVSSADASRAASCFGWRIRSVAARFEWRMS
jgi:hypothetical protein